jgi:hypothetical protein
MSRCGRFLQSILVDLCRIKNPLTISIKWPKNNFENIFHDAMKQIFLCPVFYLIWTCIQIETQK